MQSRAVPIAIVLAATVLAGCQDYNFNPVGKCVIQPGTTRFTLGPTSTADLLFVVDDSGSMLSQQESLARNFGAFIDELARMQKDRADRGLEPLDFHVAITTSAVYENLAAQGGAVCAAPQNTCSFSSFYDGGAKSYACVTPGAPCGDLITNYWAFATRNNGGACIPGVGAENTPYPQGDFVAAVNPSSGQRNPRVLHFTKDLNWASWGTAGVDTRLTALVAQFQQNIQVGTCGSGQEQHLEAARLALKKALRRDGLSQPDVPADQFPHPGAKLVVVFVGDEDDCSAAADPNRAVLSVSETSCDDAWRDPAKRPQFPPADYADFLLGLDRPIGAAFIYSATCTTGADGTRTCAPGRCACAPPTGEDCSTCPIPGNCASCPAVGPQCSGKSDGTRMKELSGILSDRGVGTVEASICDYSFARTLKSIAQLVTPPAGLQLPSQPAAGEVAVLRIIGRNGRTSRLCAGPSPEQDWWFVRCEDGSLAPPGTTTSCVAIRPGSSCEANPGETYSAEYLGLVPASGCATAATESPECATMLGGRAQDWTCEVPAGQPRGTCLCNGD